MDVANERCDSGFKKRIQISGCEIGQRVIQGLGYIRGEKEKSNKP